MRLRILSFYDDGPSREADRLFREQLQQSDAACTVQAPGIFRPVHWAFRKAMVDLRIECGNAAFIVHLFGLDDNLKLRRRCTQMGSIHDISNA